MTLSIVGAFIGCWTPYFVVHLIHVPPDPHLDHVEKSG